MKRPTEDSVIRARRRPSKLRQSVSRLSLTGLDRAAGLIGTFLDVLPNADRVTSEAWLNAQIHLLAATDLHAETGAA